MFLPEFHAKRPDNRKLAIGLDLGTSCGFSVTLWDTSKPFDATALTMFQGRIDLSLSSYETRALLGIKLRSYLNQISPDIVFVEDVKYTAGKDVGSVAAACARVYTSAEFFGGLKQIVSDWGETTQVPVSYIPIGRIKQRATGKGNAAKADVIKAHNRDFGTTYDTEKCDADDIADSGYILICGMEEHWDGFRKRGVKA